MANQQPSTVHTIFLALRAEIEQHSYLWTTLAIPVPCIIGYCSHNYFSALRCQLEKNSNCFGVHVVIFSLSIVVWLPAEAGVEKTSYFVTGDQVKWTNHIACRLGHFLPLAIHNKAVSDNFPET